MYRIGTMFWDDKYGTQGLSQDVSISLFPFIDFNNICCLDLNLCHVQLLSILGVLIIVIAFGIRPQPSSRPTWSPVGTYLLNAFVLETNIITKN